MQRSDLGSFQCAVLYILQLLLQLEAITIWLLWHHKIFYFIRGYTYSGAWLGALMSGGREREWANSNLGRTNAPEFVVNNFIVKH